MSGFSQALWVLLLGSLLGLELIGKVPPTLHTPLMSGANAISGITVLASLPCRWASPCSTWWAASW